MPKQIENNMNYCGLSIRNICLLTGLCEIIANLLLCTILILFDLSSVILAIVILLINISTILPMLIATLKQRSDIFWPYITARIVIVFCTAGGFGFCIVVYLLVKMNILNGIYNFKELMKYSGFYALLCIMSLLPLLIVKIYHRELIKREQECRIASLQQESQQHNETDEYI